MSGGKGRVAGNRGAGVPGADVLADVAAEDVVAYLTAGFVGDRSAQLDREIRDAKAGIDGPLWALGEAGGHDRAGGTSIDATRARAAMVRRWHASIEGERYQQLTQEKPRAHLLVNEAGVLGDPAKARVARIGALEQRRGIDTDLPVERLGRLLLELFDQAREPATEHVVIVLAPGVARDPG